MKKTVVNFTNKTSEEIEMSAEEETLTLNLNAKAKSDKEAQDEANHCPTTSTTFRLSAVRERSHCGLKMRLN